MKNFVIPLIGGIAKHKSLISGTHFVFSLLFMHGKSNISILGMNIDNNLAVLTIKTDILAGEADLLADTSGLFFEVDLVLIHRNLTQEDNHASLGGSFHGYFSVRVDLQAGIKDSIRDLITELIRVTFSDGLGSEIDFSFLLFC